MKNTNTTTAAASATNEKRLATMRANLARLEEEAEKLLSMADELTVEQRIRLLQLVNVSFHKSGKIEGVFSVDSSVTCDFCQKMRATAENNDLIICGLCYAAADEYKEASWRRHKLNARILSTVLFTVEELSTLPIYGNLCRFNEDGDTVNTIMGRNYLRIVKAFPATRFGYWYKNKPAVESALLAEGYTMREELPQNVRFIHSSMLIGFQAEKTWFDDAIFTVYPDKATTAEAIRNGAHECNGKKCVNCGFFCYTMRKNGSVVHIAEVLRGSKARKEKVSVAYWKKRNG